MDPADVEDLIESNLPESTANVTRARGKHDDDHLAATVVSPAFEGESLVDQHQLVYDALGDAMTTEIHALELTTETPEDA
ncbi:probable BolA-like protein [Halarchaeum acidiphilum MH1-52-1]|uniref:Probable BolA-like protein n=1 Tax=Halarchaeum acidiphilum MH1-52-1 TaxID=1261545 RepID=U3A1P7_9EURY|nr:BolA family protein [Halarchaeum acidiphilum]GAD51574.1 probable BolA-like protein [Halarchaeum acidiphilum MH1-52-1]